VEHIRQSPQEHAASTLNITEYPASLRLVVQPITVLPFPVHNVFNKCVTALLGSDRGYSKKDSPQFPGVAGLGTGPTPGQPLPLNVDKASLDNCFRPEVAQRNDDLGITVNRKAFRVQPSTLELTEIGLKLGHRAFRDRILARL
jgi:hypothetical protein